MRSSTTTGVLVLASLAAAVAVGGVASGATRPTTLSTRSTPIGTVLTAAGGRTVYLFARDPRNRSTCTGACATAWPPVTTTGVPRAAAGVRAGLLGSIARGRTRQVTYAGHPLYYFAGDRGAGQLNGQRLTSFGARWYALGPSGALDALPVPRPSPPPAPPAPSPTVLPSPSAAAPPYSYPY